MNLGENVEKIPDVLSGGADSSDVKKWDEDKSWDSVKVEGKEDPVPKAEVEKIVAYLLN